MALIISPSPLWNNFLDPNLLTVPPALSAPRPRSDARTSAPETVAMVAAEDDVIAEGELAVD